MNGSEPEARRQGEKLAYYISLHQHYAQFNWLFSAVYDPADVFVIHVDAKSGPAFFNLVQERTAGLGNVILLARQPNNWGCWSQVSNELRAIRSALAFPAGWDYFVHLTGSDYPIKPLPQIRSTLARNWPKNFVRVVPFCEIARNEPGDPHLRRRLAFQFRNRLVETRIPMPFPQRFQYKGSGNHQLTRDFCQWLTSDSSVRSVRRWVSKLRSPDEIFFQAVLMNSPFRDLRTSDAGRFDLWPGPKTLTLADYDALAASDALFARKFNCSVDREILSRLAGENGCRTPV